jgi:hypothetical protein
VGSSLPGKVHSSPLPTFLGEGLTLTLTRRGTAPYQQAAVLAPRRRSPRQVSLP